MKPPIKPADRATSPLHFDVQLTPKICPAAPKRFYIFTIVTRSGYPRSQLPIQETFCEFSFEAAHATPPYSGLHGHSFRVQVALRGEPDPVFGWSHNLYEVEPMLDEVRRLVDHRYLNDVHGLEVPTLENLTRWMWDELTRRVPGVDRVTVRRGNDGAAEGCSVSAGEAA